MDQPMYLQHLLRQKVLLMVGLIVSIVAGFFAGFTIEDGDVTPRVDRVYLASATVLLSSAAPGYFQVEIPGVTQTLSPEEAASQEIVVQEPVPLDLPANATVLAYLASSDQIKEAVAGAVDGLNDQEGIVAVSRTTQPTGSERFPGRLSLPIMDIGATALAPDRAEILATEATKAFTALVTARQDELGVADDNRLQLTVLKQPVADEGTGSNAAIPVVVVTTGVFMVFIAVALIVEAIRSRSRRRREAEPPEEAEASEAPEEAKAPEEPKAPEPRQKAKRSEAAPTQAEAPEAKAPEKATRSVHFPHGGRAHIEDGVESAAVGADSNARD